MQPTLGEMTHCRADGNTYERRGKCISHKGPPAKQRKTTESSPRAAYCSKRLPPNSQPGIDPVSTHELTPLPLRPTFGFRVSERCTHFTENKRVLHPRELYVTIEKAALPALEGAKEDLASVGGKEAGFLFSGAAAINFR